MNAEIENTVKQCATYLEYQQIQQQKILPYEIPCRPLRVVSADIFMVNNKMLLCIIDYYSKFLIVKKVDDLVADDLLQMARMIFAE